MTFLDEILELKRVRVEQAKTKNPNPKIQAERPKHDLRKALETSDGINIIAEIKRASPSKGIINDQIDVAQVAKMYEDGGATAISVLTEEDRFKGSLDDLKLVRENVSIPILRKDFVFDEFQIYEACEAGANIILLIVAMLDDETLAKLFDVAENKLGLDALVEVHTLEELERAKKLGAKIIGVNNRDLHSFNVSLDVSRELIKHAPKDALMITESGLKTVDDILELKELGYKGFLIGETLMRSGNAEEELRKLTAKS